MMRDDGGPAFPLTGTDAGWCADGMSLRDWFAGQALVSMGMWTPGDSAGDVIGRAEWAYYQADAMLEARK